MALNPISQPEVLLPDVADLTRWSVIACDQFTAQPEYWEELSTMVGAAPSSLRFILPEVWLEERLDSAPAEIGAAMHAALESGQFRQHHGYILVERTLPSGVKRLGMMANLALDDYEYTPQNNARIKATEATVPDRLPPRAAIREAAPLEMPHVLVLLNDPSQQIIETLYNRRNEFELLYDFELNMGGGHIRGWLVPDQFGVLSADFIGLERDGLLAVIGDGNHSLAAAKLTGDTNALVELVNIHSPAIEFEPIHRIIIGAGQEFIDALSVAVTGPVTTNVYHNGTTYQINIPENPADAIADVQRYIDNYIIGNSAESNAIVIDYIHGDKELVAIADKFAAEGKDAVAIFLPTIDKNTLFDYTSRRGVLPRKAFSIGHAEEKRYYLELAHRN